MRSIRLFAIASVALAAALGTAPTVAASPSAPASTSTSSHAKAAAFHCRPGAFCIYSNYNGRGVRCQWTQPRKANTADDCSFIRRGHKARSLWNGTGHRVQYYTHTNYHHRVGSTHSGRGGNLQGSYQIRSFRPQ